MDASEDEKQKILKLTNVTGTNFNLKLVIMKKNA